MNSVVDFCIIFRCAYSKIKMIKVGDKQFSVFTAGSKLLSISVSGNGCDK